MCALTGLEYMNQCTRDIISLVKELNEAAGEIIIAYTVDAGANAFLIYQLEKESLIFSGLQSILNLPED